LPAASQGYEPNEVLAGLLAERGWSYRDLGRHYADQCARQGRLPTRPSITTISRWINGRQRPTPENLHILRKLFGVSTDEQLGFRSHSGPAASLPAAGGDGADQMSEPISQRLARALQRPSIVDATLLDDLVQRTRQLDRADRRYGARRTFGEVVAHLGRITVLLEGAPDERTHRRLAVLAGDAAQLSAWLAFDLHDFDRAAVYSGLVLQAAVPGGRRELGAYGHGQQAYVAFHRGRLQDAADLVDAAVQACPRGLTGAWLARVEAEARARLGDPDGCRAALDRARELLESRPNSSGVPWVAYFADTAHLDRAEGRCSVWLRQTEQAREVLGRALALGGPYVRARGGALAELAVTYALDRNPDPAAETALRALEITRQTGSRRNLERLREVHARLTPWRSRPAVKELTAALRLAG